MEQVGKILFCFLVFALIGIGDIFLETPQRNTSNPDNEN